MCYVGVVGSVFTAIYLFKVVFYSFGYLVEQGMGGLGIVVSMVVWSSVMIDEVVEYCVMVCYSESTLVYLSRDVEFSVVVEVVVMMLWGIGICVVMWWIE